MFFILSKVLLYFIFPLTWVILLLLLSLFSKSKPAKRNFKIAAIAVFLLFSNNWLLASFARYWDAPPVPLPVGRTYSCAVILGGFGSENDKGGGYFNNGADRFLQGLKLYQQGKVSHLLITGGNSDIVKDAFREGAWAAGQLKEFGVPAEAILVENESRNTLENGRYTKQLLQQSGLKPPYVLVTSAFHMRRSLMVFKKEKLPVIPYPANYLMARGQFSYFLLLPQAEALYYWSTYIKEVIGYAVYYVKGK